MRQLSRLPWQQLYRQSCATTTRRFVGFVPRFTGRHPNGQPTSKKSTPYKPLTDRDGWEDDDPRWKQEIEERKASQPSYLMRFTCAKCLTKSGHRISKQGYYHGTVLVNCPGCNNKHLISDHLGIFSDRGVTLEDIMREKGEMLKKGVLGADGNVEFFTGEYVPDPEDFEPASSEDGETTSESSADRQESGEMSEVIPAENTIEESQVKDAFSEMLRTLDEKNHDWSSTVRTEEGQVKNALDEYSRAQSTEREDKITGNQPREESKPK